MAAAEQEYNRITIKDVLSGRFRPAPADPDIYREIRRRWDAVAKPIDSLGDFEEMTARIGAVQKNADPDLRRKCVIVLCADNGIVQEGVSQAGQEVTLAVARAMGQRTSSICRMAKRAGVDVIPVDIGICTKEEIPGVQNRKVVCGTANFAKEPAMRTGEVLEALQVGMDLAGEAKQNGCSLICTGEMGIGNTTTSAAVAAALLHESVQEMTGRGSGLDNARFTKKVRIIEEAIKQYDLYHADVLSVLSAVGGADLAGMAGIMIGGAAYGVPVVLDGVISCTAALAAVRLLPAVRDVLIASHVSREPAAHRILTALGLKPVIHAGMGLGEGSGAVMLCALLDIAMALYEDQLTFEELEIEQYQRWTDGGGV